jgi:asparagine synthase (glutamine-hydrolysing)
MCGIVGCLAFRSSKFEVTEEYIISARDTMVKRGPDGGDLWISWDRKVGLGHRRLSIIDLSEAAKQPFCNKRETIFVVFNGEIYNHAEIRNELINLGINSWKTSHSDTEVIVNAYEYWGIDFIHKLRGDFAIGLWDTRTEELYLIRDRVGVKPLYYTLIDDRLIFASEIKAILKDKEVPRKVNEKGLFHYLTFLTVQAPETLFEGIFKLAAGTYLKFSMDGVKTEVRYYDVLDHTDRVVNSMDDEEVSNQILQELKKAVHYRQVSDVPVGVFLSGGIDSSTNTALFSENSDLVRTFSIGYDTDYKTYSNELEYARLVADRFHAEHHERILNEKDLIDFLPEMVDLQDEPLADPVCIPVYYVSELARRNGVTVCQVGEGADELFFGYKTWGRILQVHRLNKLPIPKILKHIVSFLMRKYNRSESIYYEYLQRGIRNEPIFWTGSEAFTDNEKKKLLSDRLVNKFKGTTSYDVVKPYWEQYCSKANKKDTINWMAYMDLNLRLPELLLMRVDKMSMGVSLEARVPFLDHHVVQLAMSIQGDRKFKKSIYKSLLKQAVRGLIPDEVIDRKKQGFGAPIGDWYQSNLGEDAYKTLREFCTSTDYLNWVEVEKLLKSNQASKTWPLLNLALWYNHYIRRSN